jgi:hypothetical protein
MNPSDDTKLEVLHDHYKDTFAYQREYIKNRDRLFLVILFLLILMLFQIFAPAEAGGVISEVISDQLKLSKTLNISFLGSVIWWFLLGAIVRYFQTVIQIERQYIYIHRLEDQLSSLYTGGMFTRESKSYLVNYPVFLNWAWSTYSIVFPFLLIVITIAKMRSELLAAYQVSLLLLGINLVNAALIIIATLSYSISIYAQKQKENRASEAPVKG